MNQPSNKDWTNASLARKELTEQLQGRPDVCFVDIGYPQGNPAEGQVSLRIHVCGSSTSDTDDTFPTEVSGVPVVVSSVFERKE